MNGGLTMEDGSVVKAAEENFKADHRKKVREFELERVLPLFPPGSSIVEVGAGAGWQAKQLAIRGFKVTAIDIAQSRYNALKEWDVINYDGHRIPLEDKSVDVVFSSNVLEHIPHVDEFMGEMRRVLRPGGVAVHVMPTTLWRFITTVTFYIQRVQLGLKIGNGHLNGGNPKDETHGSGNGGTHAKKGLAAKLRRMFLPTVHGVRGNVLSEHYYFSKSFWLETFDKGGWNVVSTEGAGLLYSGYRVCGHRLSLESRKTLAKLIGSSCRIYIAYPK